MPRGVSTSSWCVCQFHHLRTEVNLYEYSKGESVEEEEGTRDIGTRD